MLRFANETKIPQFPDDFSGRRVWLRTTAEMAGVLEFVIADLVGAAYPPRDRFAMRLALEEAVVNALKHGNGYDSGKQVRVRWIVTTEHVLAEVTDQGCGFDAANIADARSPQNLERPCGRGLLLMNQFLTCVRLNSRGNVVTLYKRRSEGRGPRGEG